MFCRNCGKQIDDHAAFCGYCGTPVTKSASGNGRISGSMAGGFGGGNYQPPYEVVPPEPVKKGKKKPRKGMSKRAKGLLIALIVVAVLGAAGGAGAFFCLRSQNQGSPLVAVEDGKLVYLSGPKAEGNVLDKSFENHLDTDIWGGEASAASAELENVQFNADGTYAVYLQDDELYLIDAEQAAGKHSRNAMTEIDSDVYMENIWLVGDYLYYEKNQEDGMELWCCGLAEQSKEQIGWDVWDIAFNAYEITPDGQRILFQDDDTVCIYDATENRRQELMTDAEAIYCNQELSEVVCMTDEEQAYRITLDGANITANELIYQANNEEEYIYYANSSVVITCENDSDDAIVYRNGDVKRITVDELLPVTAFSGFRSNASNQLSTIKGSQLVGFGEGGQNERYIVDDNMDAYRLSEQNVYSVEAAVWDPDHEILYALYEVRNSSGYQLYAYPMEDGRITGETLVAEDCGYYICYDSGSQSLLYYTDYDQSSDTGTLCSVTEGKYQKPLLENAYLGFQYAGAHGGQAGLGFLDELDYFVAWSDVSDGSGTLNVVNLQNSEPVETIAKRVRQDSCVNYDGSLMYIGDFRRDTGGDLYRYDGKKAKCVREDVMAAAGGVRPYFYLYLSIL